MSGSRPRISSNITRISIFARLAPRQKCGPRPPNARCSFGVRPTSKDWGSSKTSSSRFAAPYQIVTLSPAAIGTPRSSVSAVAVRRKYCTGLT